MLIEIAALLDRYDRAAGAGANDQRIELIYAALERLADRTAASNRSEQLLNLFTF